MVDGAPAQRCSPTRSASRERAYWQPPREPHGVSQKVGGRSEAKDGPDWHSN